MKKLIRFIREAIGLIECKIEGRCLVDEQSDDEGFQIQYFAYCPRCGYYNWHDYPKAKKELEDIKVELEIENLAFNIRLRNLLMITGSSFVIFALIFLFNLT